jgi:hypothetical protein
MTEDFTAAIAAWQLFYSLTGSAAFTLAGLVFVAVSINIGMFALAGSKGIWRNSHDKLSAIFWR